MFRKIFYYFLPLVIIISFSQSTFAETEVYTSGLTVDKFVQQRSPENVFSDIQHLTVGYDRIKDHQVTRTYIKYDLAPFLSKNAAVEVSSAKLNLFVYKSMLPIGFALDVYIPTESWENPITNWITQPEQVGPVISTYVPPNTGIWSRIDITEIIRKQIESSSWDLGLVLRANDESEQGGGAKFFSSKCQLANICDSNQLPYIEILYEVVEEEEVGEVIGVVDESVMIPDSTEGEEKLSLPSKPTISLSPISSTQQVSLSINTTDYVYADVYNLGGFHARFTPKSAKVVVQKWIPGAKYSFYVIIEDENGKRSTASNLAVIDIPPTDNPIIDSVRLGNAIGTSPSNLQKCRYKFNETLELITRLGCITFSPLLSEIRHVEADPQLYWINSFGKYGKQVEISIERVKCKSRSITNPKSWFNCDEEYVNEKKFEIESDGDLLAKVQSISFPAYISQWQNQAFQLITASGKNLTGKQLAVKSEVIFSHKLSGKTWLDENIKTGFSNGIKIQEATKSTTPPPINKPFRFPFSRAINVNQWYGKTAFSDHHAGIDFAASSEPIYAIGDGYIRKAEWDNANGKCLSGGLYTFIAHDNGMHSLYLHLADFKKNNGQDWKVGERVRQGDLIGKTGNTGMYNCQPLANHLHLEVWLNEKYSSNTNPVNQISTNWDDILTARVKEYPGRLTGENPHPGR